MKPPAITNEGFAYLAGAWRNRNEVGMPNRVFVFIRSDIDKRSQRFGLSQSRRQGDECHQSVLTKTPKGFLVEALACQCQLRGRASLLLQVG